MCCPLVDDRMTSQHCQSVVDPRAAFGVILSSIRGQTHKQLASICFLQQQKLEKVKFAGKNEENTTRFMTFLN